MCRIIFLLVPIFYFFAEFRTDGFRTNKILADHPIEYQCKKKYVSKLTNILDQKFIYLDRGRQSFVFESEDKKYVLKFVNFNNIKYPYFLRYFDFLDILKRSLDRKDKRYPWTFESMILSYEKLAKETGIVYVHIGKKEDVRKKVRLVTKYGQEFCLDIDSTCFILQKKMMPVYSYLRNADEEEFKKALKDIVEIFYRRSVKGILDDDLNIEKNLGFYKNKAKIMDVGKLYFDKIESRDDLQKEMDRSLKFLKKWIFENYPKYDQFLKDYIDEKISSF